MRRIRPQGRFRLADSAQQVVGGFLLAGPFVVTEEVWTLARDMNSFQLLLTVTIVFAIGYAALYKAAGRDPDDDRDLAGVPTRFLSLMLVSYGSVAILAVAFGAPGTFLDDLVGVEMVVVTLRAIAVGAVFSVVGAATADSVF
ncbi:DUF2391 family protein [Natronomonas gomsonensis]|jgi:uncharacterized membrane protein|uniref:DUF2391 family protein n=1 Tax=Natronomonas gomsonensis TaxID=1046043 RepID=UPI0020CA4E67|nr:DUF2391 family protein [Natronomonas gomsonensis]MCY4729759.1 DUF2391 family protein [Natronomonas gomsonensis]